MRGRIRIISVPSGEAPLGVREAWVGLELPCWGAGPTLSEEGVISRREQPPRESWFVSQEHAMEILREACPDAYAWWRRHGYPRRGYSFTFGFAEAEIVDGDIPRSLITLN